MSIYTFHEEESDIATIADGDKFPIFDASAGRTKYGTALELATYMQSIGSLNSSGHTVFEHFEDFLGTWAIGDAGPADRFSTTAGSGTSTQVATTVAASLNGEVTIKSSTDDGANSANSTTLTEIGLSYKANSGGLVFQTRLKLDAITAVALFVGFTDTISTTVELPIFLVAGDIDSDATDACGVAFDTDGTTDQWFHGGVKNGTDTVPAYSGTAPEANVYVTIRVEVSAAGAVTGYVNGTAIGTAVANAVTITTALTPMIVVSSRSAAQRICTIDYWWTQQNRIA